MTLTTHAAIGAALGSCIGNPLLGFALALASHFLVDIIPHGDNKLADSYRVLRKKRAGMAYVTLDAATAIIFLMLILPTQAEHTTGSLAFSSAVIGSVLPDFCVALKELFPRNTLLKKIFAVHFFFHDCISRTWGDVRLSYALAAQAIFIALLTHYVIL